MIKIESKAERIRLYHAQQNQHWREDPFADQTPFFNQRQIDLRDALRNKQ
jgi:hypothetical protein